jgi:uncharacterized protein DUF4262
MHTALDADPERLDRHERKFVENIRDHGWFHTSVFEDKEGPGFGFTTGFWLTLNFPEVLVFSMKKEDAHDIFWHMFREIRSGHVFELRKPIGNVIASSDAVLIPVPTHQLKVYCGWSRWFYGGDDFQCVQLVWPDAKGVFPWQPGADARLRDAQPDVSEADWGGLRGP